MFSLLLIFVEAPKMLCKLIPAVFSILWITPLPANELLIEIPLDQQVSAAPFQAPEGLQFVIEFPSLTDPGDFERFGRNVFWQDDSSGQFDFTRDNSPDFPQLQFLLTNGADDWLNFLTHNSLGRGGGPGNAESDWGFGNPDLIGNQIDLIRLVVHKLEIESYSPGPPFGDGLEWDARITWEFWGTPVPEPASLIILALSLALPRRLRCRR
ncbi:MAG: hypothetical protein DCC65_17620 [Planctomycetota bacterium]|nr:MAG: hypothetical protein DCC65_17620 [Planctomycetota bacterium]